MQATALSSGQVADDLLLIAALEIEPPKISTRSHLELADVDDVEPAGNGIPHALVVRQRVAELIDRRHAHGRADNDLAGIGLFLAGDHAKQRRLARAVGSDDADDRTCRHTEREVIDQQRSP